MLHRYRPFLVHVSLRACTQLREGGGAFQALAECKNLQDLNLSDCAQLSVLDSTRLDLYPFITILTINTNHRWVTVACARARAALQDQVVRAVVQQCPMLLYLNLSRTPIGDTGIWSIAKCATHLSPILINHWPQPFNGLICIRAQHSKVYTDQRPAVATAITSSR